MSANLVSPEASLLRLLRTAFPCVFAWSSPVCASLVSLCVQSSSYKATSPKASFRLDFKGLISKYCHILRYWGLDFQYMNSGQWRLDSALNKWRRKQGVPAFSWFPGFQNASPLSALCAVSRSRCSLHILQKLNLQFFAGEASLLSMEKDLNISS